MKRRTRSAEPRRWRNQSLHRGRSVRQDDRLRSPHQEGSGGCRPTDQEGPDLKERHERSTRAKRDRRSRPRTRPKAMEEAIRLPPASTSREHTDTSNSSAVDSEVETSWHRRQKSDLQSTFSTECSISEQRDQNRFTIERG